ncbi:NAD(P)H-hydrate dehydratase [Paracoccus sp. MC1862]|uniref:NAD(P)H-hydrate dehydratase n=1 Tax=Paracoccus sp. MC1862 TaxID=2760307 RepID=UPI00160206B8|nr:NAD(P)H-hydrate dehydratase [Paracoccus sp. MC1862]MBB1497696.1 NAD(P)H-hydrate dehydratase [Paracoccus sp. MC1862]QQO44131.1 NAD(P)H-hydrate dehydratase [Paracoccus sp. MC1862]
MSEASSILDAAWLRRHPLPVHPEDTDKNSRGRVMLVGGSLRVPGGLILTALAAFRAGAGKVQMGLPEPLAIPTGIAMPEAGIFALPHDEDGEIADASMLVDKLGGCGCLVLGPAMASPSAALAMMDALLPAADAGPVLIDAACVGAAAARLAQVEVLAGGAILTPHVGEMAQLTGLEAVEIEARRDEIAVEWSTRLKAVIVMKGATTLIASPDGEVAAYGGGGVGLATGGSGDVLTGIIAGLCARGLPAYEAACWGVWLHGEAGRRLAERLGPMGFMARELPAEVPSLMRGI